MFWILQSKSITFSQFFLIFPGSSSFQCYFNLHIIWKIKLKLIVIGCNIPIGSLNISFCRFCKTRQFTYFFKFKWKSINLFIPKNSLKFRWCIIFVKFSINSFLTVVLFVRHLHKLKTPSRNRSLSFLKSPHIYLHFL